MSSIQQASDDDACAVDYALLMYAASSEENIETTTALATGGKTKPCTKFFSTSGCPYGESCHFLHFVSGGIAALGMQVPPIILKQQQQQQQLPGINLHDPSVSINGYKTRLCNRFNTPEGCRFADNCHFAHGEADLRRPNFSKVPTSTLNLYHAPSYNHAAAMLQSADAAYNNTTTYNPMQTTVDSGGGPYSYGTPVATCSFTYPTIVSSATCPCPVLYNPPSNFTVSGFCAEPTPPGVTAATTPHVETALLTV